MIKGLTNKGLSFPHIGNIRKGDKSGTNGAPKDLSYFKVDFDEREVAAIAAWNKFYSDKPTQINIMLPFNEIERCWDAWCEAYTAGRLLARSDGENFVYRVDPANGEILVQNGLNVKTGKPEPHVTDLGMAGKSKIKCRPVGRLKVIVPELKRLAYLVVHTTSVIDIGNISDQLAAIQSINGGKITGVPLVLKRTPRSISVPRPDGTKVRMTKWMLSVEANPDWVAAKITQMNNLALPDIITNNKQILSLPEPIKEEDEDWGDEEPMTFIDEPLEIKDLPVMDEVIDSPKVTVTETPDELADTKKELIKVITSLGGSQNPVIMAIVAEYIPSKNVKFMKELDKAKELLNKLTTIQGQGENK